MNDLLHFYQQEASKRFSNIPWLQRLQQHALSDFMRLGFPTRHDEDWKYSSVTDFAKQTFNQLNTNITELTELAEPRPNLPMTALLKQGQITVTASVPRGVLIVPISEALAKHSELVTPYLNQILSSQHGFHALNSAMLKDGLFIYIPEKVQLEEPLLLTHWQDIPNQANYLRHLIVAEKASSATIIEEYLGQENCCYFTNTVTEIHLAQQANLQHYKIQREGNCAYHVGQLVVKQAQASEFTSHSFSAGGKWVRSDTQIDLAEEQARCQMQGIYFTSEGQHIDHHTLVNHRVPRCHSEQDYKGILRGKSRAVFNGRVVVAKDAIHTEARQYNKNLLLTPNAEINTKPQLEIFADDVICTHGATVGQLDQDALFYLATRGVTLAEARQFLISAFVKENLQAIKQQTLAAWLDVLLKQQLR